MTEPKPIVPVNPEGLDDIAKSLLENSVPEFNASAPPAGAVGSVEEPGSYIILPGRKHGSYEYPDLLVPAERTHKGKKWHQAKESLYLDGAYMITPRQFVDFINLLRSGNAYNGLGVKLDTKRVKALLDDILEQKDPYRAEWLDARFAQSGKTLNVMYHKIKSDGSIEDVAEPLHDCLMEDKQPGISLDYWLRNANNQGLPPKNISDGSIYYWYPRDKAVARFRANSDGVFLYANRDPAISYSSLGVRAAKIKR